MINSNNKPRILTYDIETSHSIAAIFGLWDQSIPTDNILQEWFIITAAWKWLGDDTIYGATMADDGKMDSDLNVVMALAAAIESADLVIGHNSDKFDIKKLNTRILFHELAPLPKVMSLDTLKIARRIAKFTSNRLDYIANYLGLGGKMQTSKGLWLRIIRGGDDAKEAIKEMFEYNKVDVEITEKVYLKLRPYMDNHPNLSQLMGELNDSCPTCSSFDLEKRGYTYNRSGKYQRFICKACGTWSKGKSALLTTGIR